MLSTIKKKHLNNTGQKASHTSQLKCEHSWTLSVHAGLDFNAYS